MRGKNEHGGSRVESGQFRSCPRHAAASCKLDGVERMELTSDRVNGKSKRVAKGGPRTHAPTILAEMLPPGGGGADLKRSYAGTLPR